MLKPSATPFAEDPTTAEETEHDRMDAHEDKRVIKDENELS
jgi:hypothetical protein